MNPLLLKFGPYAIAAALGFSGAWYVQGVRLDSARNDLIEYKQAALGATLKAEAAHQQINQEVSDGWAKNLAELRRRFAAGRVLPAGNHQTDVVPASAGEPDGAAAESDTGAGGLAPPLSRQKCAEDALQVLNLQFWIDKTASQ